MTGIRKSDNASHPAGRSRMWSNVHDLFHVRNMFYSQTAPVFYDSCANKPAKRSSQQGENIKRQKDFGIKKQTPRREARRKSWEVSQREALRLYEIYAADPSPFLAAIPSHFVAYLDAHSHLTKPNRDAATDVNPRSGRIALPHRRLISCVSGSVSMPHAAATNHFWDSRCPSVATAAPDSSERPEGRNEACNLRRPIVPSCGTADRPRIF